MGELARGPSDVLTELAFRLRNFLRWSLPPWKIPAGSWERGLATLPAEARARAALLRARTELGRWPQLLTPIELQENLHLLDVLSGLIPGDVPEGPALDVGSKNGATLPALVAAARRPFDLVEIDPHRRYVTLATRRAHGEKMARAFPGCRYIAGSVTDLVGAYALVTWVLPFVHERPLRAWGLPRRLFAPERLLRHVAGLVAPGGALVIINQGEGERQTQRELFATLGLNAEDRGLVTGPLSPFRRPRFAFVWRRPRAP